MQEKVNTQTWKKKKNTTHKMQNLSESYVQNLEHKATAKADLKSGSKNV